MNLLDHNIGQLARRIPGATRIFNQYQLDFCCNGNQRLGDVLQERGINPQGVLAALTPLINEPQPDPKLSSLSTSDLIDHILSRYHALHREQLPELIRLARRVEHVHGEQAYSAPAAWPIIWRGCCRSWRATCRRRRRSCSRCSSVASTGAMVHGPISVMRFEHEQHGAALARLAELTNDLQRPGAPAPPGARSIPACANSART